MVNDVFIGWLNVTTSVALAGAGEKTGPSTDELTMGRHIGREERVAVGNERLAAHVHDLIAKGVGADGHDIGQVDARGVGVRIDGPGHGVAVDLGDRRGRDAVDLQLAGGQRVHRLAR